MASLPLITIFKAITVLVDDPRVIYDLIEEAYRKDFMEKVFWQIYGHLIRENTEPRFANSIELIEKSCKYDISEIHLKF
jgi:hypothetical protein